MFGWDFLLMLSRDSEDEMWSRFMFELLIWLQEATLARWTQSSGPLCLWQCFCMKSHCQQSTSLHKIHGNLWFTIYKRSWGAQMSDPFFCDRREHLLVPHHFHGHLVLVRVFNPRWFWLEQGGQGRFCLTAMTFSPSWSSWWCCWSCWWGLAQTNMQEETWWWCSHMFWNHLMHICR